MAESGKKLTGKIQTVLGVMEAGEIGITLPHEHVLLDMPVWFFESEDPELRKLAYEPVSMEHLWWIRQHPFCNLDNLRLVDEQQAIIELMRFKQAGGNTIVDMTNQGLGRNPEALTRISRATGLNIVMGTGYYVGEALTPDYDAKTEDEIAQEIIADIKGGAGDTGIRAGIIGEIGCSWPLTEREKKGLAAASQAQRRTGAAINIHPGHDIHSPLEIVAFLQQAGADLNRVVISHLDRIIHPPSLLTELAAMNCYLEYDLFGSHMFNPISRGYGQQARPCDRERIEQIIALIAQGCLGQILMSHDMCMKIKLTRYGGPGYAHILTNIVPQMIEREITPEQVHAIMVENPRRLLTLRLDRE